LRLDRGGRIRALDELAARHNFRIANNPGIDQFVAHVDLPLSAA